MTIVVWFAAIAYCVKTVQRFVLNVKAIVVGAPLSAVTAVPVSSVLYCVTIAAMVVRFAATYVQPVSLVTIVRIFVWNVAKPATNVV